MHSFGGILVSGSSLPAAAGAQIFVAVKRGSPLVDRLATRAVLTDAVAAAAAAWEFDAAPLVAQLYACSFKLGMLLEAVPGARWSPWPVDSGTAQDPKAQRLRYYLDGSVQEG